MRSYNIDRVSKWSKNRDLNCHTTVMNIVSYAISNHKKFDNVIMILKILDYPSIAFESKSINHDNSSESIYSGSY